MYIESFTLTKQTSDGLTDRSLFVFYKRLINNFDMDTPGYT